MTNPCNHATNRVVDSRLTPSPNVLRRRRRECVACGERFSTVEIPDTCMKEIKGYEFELWIERRLASAREKRAHRTTG